MTCDVGFILSNYTLRLLAAIYLTWAAKKRQISIAKREKARHKSHEFAVSHLFYWCIYTKEQILGRVLVRVLVRTLVA